MLILALALSLSVLAAPPHDASTGVAATSGAATTGGPRAVAANDGFNDGIDRTDPNFVTASLLVVSPSDEIYSCVGHSGIRLECPTFRLDYCFTYESESAKDKVIPFIRGKLKMGMFSMPTSEYLKSYAADGRGVVQYRLNLPPEVKQRLWKLLDEQVTKGAELPYDCLKRGCAQSIYTLLCEAVKPMAMELPPWTDKYQRTRREFVDLNAVAYPWDRFFLYALIGVEADRSVPCEKKIIVPLDLLEVLQNAKLNGSVIVADEGVELLPTTLITRKTWVTPLMVSIFVAVFSMVNLLLASSCIDVLLLGFQSVAGAFFTYILFVSDFPGSGWNWLIVPFNLLPLVFWKWRQKWALWFAGVLVLWEIGMICWPHRLTDPAYLVLVGAYIIFYLKFTRFGRNVFVRVHHGMATCKGFLQAQTGDNP